KWFQRLICKIRAACASTYTRALVARGMEAGPVAHDEMLEKMASRTIWAEKVDEAIAEFIDQGIGDEKLTTKAQRALAIEMVKEIHALDLRSEVYQKILNRFGPLKETTVKRIKNKWKAQKAYDAAAVVWTEPVLEKLRNAATIMEAFNIAESAWESHAKATAADCGKSKAEAYDLLVEVRGAYLAIETPQAAEVGAVFREGSPHRDGFLEKIAKKRSTDFGQIRALEDFKSYRTESGYHIMAKLFFEAVDDEMERLTKPERAEVVLFLSGLDEKLRPELKSKIEKKIYGQSSRRKALNQLGKLKMSDVRTFMRQAHPDQRVMAFRGLFSGGVVGDKESEKVITDRLLFSDPRYLRKLLQVFLRVADDEERSVYVSSLLGRVEKGGLSGPEIVSSMVEQGGVVAKKLAQIIDSHGLKLDPEYRDALKRFKGDAQAIDKIQFMKWAKQRLPADKLEQIESFDRELGSGSFKIAYLCTLKDGRRIVVKMPRQYVIEKTAREFELTRNVLDAMMADPELQRDSLGPIRAQMERIVTEEMKLANEFEFIKTHKKAYDARPPLVRWLGNSVEVCIPQPLEGWNAEDILVDEYVPSKSWNELPDTSLVGWSKKKLARAAVNETLNQMLSCINPETLVGGEVILDIDPHEENQLAASSWLGLRKKMVNIDLGQSVRIAPEKMQGLMQMVAFIQLGRIDEAVEKSKEYMEYRSASDAEEFGATIKQQRESKKDPFEILAKTFEALEDDGVFLKEEWMFFQKLFATMVGLKRHLGDPNYIAKRAKKILLLHAVSDPKKAIQQVKVGKDELDRLKTMCPTQ
ncbi:AarF/UbiB family protein, partial [Myxococcota bacterium]